MKIAIASLALVTSLAACGPVEAADPLAPARAGQLQCYTPDPARKTCRALAGYTFEAGAGGETILNQAEVLMATDPVRTVKTVSPVFVRGDSVCGRVQPLADAVFLIDGRPADAAMADRLRRDFTARRAAMTGREVCTRYLPFRDQLVPAVSVDGVEREPGDDRVIWVEPNDGWTVAP